MTKPTTSTHHITKHAGFRATNSGTGRWIASALVASILTGLAAMPAQAEQSQLSKILFGTFYNDGVSVVDASHHPSHDGIGLPLMARYPSDEQIETSQAEVRNSSALSQALQKRHIRISNVIWIQTAMNGGKIVYIK